MGDDITPERLESAFGIHWRVAGELAPVLQQAALNWGILRAKERCAWLAQLAHESALFTRTEENLNYSAERLVAVWPKRFGPGKADPAEYARNPEKLANFVYANRMGNGPPESGDGWLYRGRGYIQITGRENYERYFAAVGGTSPPMSPGMLSSPRWAADSAGWFWAEIGGNRYVRDGDFAGLTKRINGGLHGISQRAILLASAEKAFT